MQVPFYKPNVGDLELEAIREVFESGWLTTGAKVQEFEIKFLEYMQIQGHAVGTNSGTAALHLAMEIIDLKHDEMVLMPALTFVATAEVVTYYGGSIGYVDCDDRTLNMDLEDLESVLEHYKDKKIKAVMPVHYTGRMIDIQKVKTIVAKYRNEDSPIWVIEDAAHCCPAAYMDTENCIKKVGTESDIACFSFYPTKPITTGQGGMLTTPNEKWSEKARIARSHGLKTSTWQASNEDVIHYQDVEQPGYKYNMTNIAAAMGLVQLEKADSMRADRLEAARYYDKKLKGIRGIQRPLRDCLSSWHLYVIRVGGTEDTICMRDGICIRDSVMKHLKENGIGCAINWRSLDQHSFYGRFTRPKSLIDTKLATDEIISLPLFPGITKEQIDYVVEKLKEAFENTHD